MRFVDSHAHIFSEEFQEDFEAVLTRAKESGVEKIMIITTEPDEARKAMEFQEKDPQRYQVAYGIHPEYIADYEESWFEEFVEIVKDPRISAVGEIGLDYHWDKDHKQEQKSLFKRQIEVAVSLDKPILVHSRDAMQDTFDVMVSTPSKGLLHCFPGSIEMAREFTKRGYYIALGGAITFKNARHSIDVVEGIDLDYLLSETDCPYMAPVPHRGHRNEPSYIPLIVEKFAEVRGISFEDMSERVYQNYLRFIGEIDEAN